MISPLIPIYRYRPFIGSTRIFSKPCTRAGRFFCNSINSFHRVLKNGHNDTKERLVAFSFSLFESDVRPRLGTVRRPRRCIGKAIVSSSPKTASGSPPKLFRASFTNLKCADIPRTNQVFPYLRASTAQPRSPLHLARHFRSLAAPARCLPRRTMHFSSAPR